MSAHPRFSISPPTIDTSDFAQSNNNTNFPKAAQKAQPQVLTKNPAKVNHQSDSETDISTENLTMEERYVLRHTTRVEPQGQENLQETSGQDTVTNDNRFSSNTSSTDSTTRYPPSTPSGANRSISEARNPMYVSTTGNSNRNSLKDAAQSNRSSMDVSTCSYNTLIIHNDDSLYSNGSDFGNSLKKERPRSYGNEHQMQEIAEIPDDYLSQSQVLKHLAKDIKLPNRRSNTSVASDNTAKESPKYSKNDWADDQSQIVMSNKLKSKSQPDLSRIIDIDLDSIEALMKENVLLKQQLNNCYMKAKTQKLEEEVANIYRVHHELRESCERREKLERAARMRLQSELQRQQEFNKALKDQVDIYQSQLLAPSEHQMLIAQLFTQNKELNSAKDRQEIEIEAQRATLAEQRNHIGILDTALQNAQLNIRRLEEELRKKQMYVERLVQIQQHSAMQKGSGDLQRKLRLDYSDNDVSKDSNRSGSSTNSGGETKWIQDKSSQIMRIENECHKLEDAVFRQNIAKGIDKNTQEAERILAEAKQDKLRYLYLEEVHSAQKRVSDLQTHLKVLESHLAQKDAVIRALNPKTCGSNSFDSYSDSYGLSRPLVSNNSQASFNVSNVSFNTSLDQNYGQSNHLSSSSSLLANNGNNYSGITTGAFISSGGVGVNYVTNKINNNSQSSSPSLNYNNQSSCNIQNLGNYSPNSNYDPPTPTNLNPPSPFMHHTSYSPSPNNYDHHHVNHHLQQMQLMDGGRMGGRKFDDQSKRGLCCFPGLSTKKPMDEVSILSSKNSDAFLQKLAQQLDRQESPSSSIICAKRIIAANGGAKKSSQEDINLLEKILERGRCSQKLRSTGSNLSQVSQSVGQNMTDISTIDSAKQQPKNSVSVVNRGTSLPPSVLPRPQPRGLLKPPRKIDYGFSDKRDTAAAKSQQVPIQQQQQQQGTLNNRNGEMLNQGRREFSPMMNEKLEFCKYQDYGTMKNDNGKYLSFSTASQMIGTGKNNGGQNNEFCKPDFTSTKNYQRLDESPSRSRRSLLPKMTTPPLLTIMGSKNARDSINSSSSTRMSPLHHRKNDSNLTFQSSPSPSRHFCRGSSVKSSSVGPSIYISPSEITSNSANGRNHLPPKTNEKRGNRYRIQI